MSTLGKILVGVNFLFSILVTGFLIMDFAKRTQWQKGYRDAVEQLEKQNAANLKLVAEASEKIAKLETAEKNARESARTSEDKAKKAEEKAKTNDDEKAKAVKDRDAAIEREKVTSAERDNLAAAHKQKDDLIAKHLATITEQAQALKTANDEKIKYKTIADSLKYRNEGLVKQIETMQKDLSDLRNDRALRSGTRVENPPPDDVKGTIKATDPQSGLVTVNLGSDSGLSKGNTLHVYRLTPRPTYVGVLRIMDVRPNEAIGKLTSSARPNAIQVGDEVASKILDNQ